MSAPALTTFAQGLGVASADNLNTYESTCDNLAQLRAFIGVQGVQVFLRGYVSPNDGGQGPFYWSSTATGPDNGTTIIVPSGVSQGAWLRISLTPYSALVLTWTGAQTASSTFLGGEAADFAYILPKNLTGSAGLAPLTLPTTTYTVVITKNGAATGATATCSTGGVWTFVNPSDVAIAITDQVRFIGPGDTTIADFGLTIKVRLA